MDARQSVIETLTRYVEAYRRGDAAGCAACFLPDAALYSAFAPPAIGRQAITDLHADWAPEPGGEKTLQLLEFDANGDKAWCLARFAEGKETGEGHSLCVLESQTSGDWLIRICSLTAGE